MNLHPERWAEFMYELKRIATNLEKLAEISEAESVLYESMREQMESLERELVKRTKRSFNPWQVTIYGNELKQWFFYAPSGMKGPYQLLSTAEAEALEIFPDAKIVIDEYSEDAEWQER